MKESMIKEMVVTQDKFNQQVNYYWKNQSFDWLLAAAGECMELCKHLGSEWWKEKPKTNIFQQRLEIVDIFCFCLSHEMRCESDRIENIPGFIQKSSNNYKLDKIVAAKKLAHHCLAGIFDLTDFARLCRAFDLDFFTLYRMFTAKNALNHHRQVNGYFVGLYNKVWRGEEDNIHLEELYMQLGLTENEHLYDEMVKHLQMRYDQIGNV